MSGDSKACAGDQTRSCSRPTSTHPIEDADEGQSIVAPQRYRGVHILLRGQYLGEGFCELAGSYVNGPELREECIPGRWDIRVSQEVVLVSGEPLRTHGHWTSLFGGRARHWEHSPTEDHQVDAAKQVT